MLLRELVAEFTLTDNPANTTTSLLRSMCHVDDSVILGSWLQETDHKAIEDQVTHETYEGLGMLEGCFQLDSAAHKYNMSACLRSK